MNISNGYVEETIRVIGEMQDEVRQLRQANYELSQKAEAYDALVTALGVRPPANRTMREDPLGRAERIHKRLIELQAAMPKPMGAEEVPDPA